VDLDKGITAVLVTLRHEAVRRRRSPDGDVSSLGVELEASERAACEARQNKVFRHPVRLGVRRFTEPLGDRKLETLGPYAGQRVITTFFSV
jgi:hypothetical protein